MKRKLFIFVLFILCSICLTGCFGKRKFPKGYDKEKTISLSKKIVEEVHVNGLRDTLEKYMREDYFKEYPIDDMEKDWKDIRSGVGEFVEFTQTSIAAKESPDDKNKRFIVVMLTATYEKKEIIFTLTFDEDSKVVGFYAKN